MVLKRNFKTILILRAAFLLILTLASVPVIGAELDPVVKITLLHMNDVYEITPVSGGKEGGLSRVATLRKELLKKNPNTFTILAGDLFSPSALGTAKVNGERLSGRQMVAVMNEVGLDYATFGNHEFDIKKEAFYERLKESKFTWFSSNVFDENGKPFPGVSDTVVFNVVNDAGVQVRVGLIGVTLNSNPKDYVTYKDSFETVKTKARALRNKVDILIAVTHLALEHDIRIAEGIPEIDLILGGHEHEYMQVWRGSDYTPVFKADANARTVYIHDLTYHTAHAGPGVLEIKSRLHSINGNIADDRLTAKLIKKWVEKGFEGFRKDGFNPEKIVAQTTEPMDGREASVRNRPTKLTDLIAKAMMNAVQGSELAVFNGGSIRIDDILPPGDISEYDVLRVLPFGGKILSVQMEGSLLNDVLEQGQKNQGTGGYLQTANVKKKGSQWWINDTPIEPNKIYPVAISDFLLTGNETGLDYLKCKEENEKGYMEKCSDERLKFVSENEDIRKALISQLQKTGSADADK